MAGISSTSSAITMMEENTTKAASSISATMAENITTTPLLFSKTPMRRNTTNIMDVSNETEQYATICVIYHTSTPNTRPVTTGITGRFYNV